MSLRHALLAAVIGLGLTACADMGGLASGTSNSANSGSQPGGLQGLPVFLNKLEAARGSALSITDRLAIGGVATESKSLLDGTQNRFFDAVGQRTGLGADTLKLLAPNAAAPLSSNEMVAKVESKLGRRLNNADSDAIKAAAALRNNSLASLKDGFADKVGTRTGVGKDTVLALLPLIGM